MLTYNFTEIVKKIEIRLLHFDRHGNKSTVIYLEDTVDSVQEQRHHNLGRCYTYRPELGIRTVGVDSIRTYL